MKSAILIIGAPIIGIVIAVVIREIAALVTKGLHHAASAAWGWYWTNPSDNICWIGGFIALMYFVRMCQVARKAE